MKHLASLVLLKCIVAISMRSACFSSYVVIPFIGLRGASRTHLCGGMATVH